MSIRWTVGVLLIGFCVHICVLHILLLWRYIRRKEHHSPIPLIGALSGIVGLAALPPPESDFWFCVPVVTDLGTIVVLLALGDLVARKILRR